ncbi:MAG: trp operon repressor [Verrucomicrobia bacterium]|nr:trp operon repressor [Verrucomicrobiota bacterium]
MSQKKDDEGWWGFLKLCSKIKSPEEFKRFFDLFLTIEEKETLGRRFLIVKALQEGKLTQREIAEQFGVSISQITRGSNALKIIDPSLKKSLDKLI